MDMGAKSSRFIRRMVFLSVACLFGFGLFYSLASTGQGQEGDILRQNMRIFLNSKLNMPVFPLLFLNRHTATRGSRRSMFWAETRKASENM